MKLHVHQSSRSGSFVGEANAQTSGQTACATNGMNANELHVHQSSGAARFVGEANAHNPCAICMCDHCASSRFANCTRHAPPAKGSLCNSFHSLAWLRRGLVTTGLGYDGAWLRRGLVTTGLGYDGAWFRQG